MVASQTTLPVIGVPMAGGVADGLDALLAIVQMPKGVPVATVGVGNGENAGLLAASILSVSDASPSRTASRRGAPPGRLDRGRPGERGALAGLIPASVARASRVGAPRVRWPDRRPVARLAA